MQTVFGNLPELASLHRRLLTALQAVQTEQWPFIHSITRVVQNCLLNAHDIYATYIHHSVLGAYLIERETAINHPFREFLEVCDSRLLSVDMMLNLLH